MSEELGRRAANAQDLIITILEKLSPSYADDGWFVPRGVIMERLRETVGEDVPDSQIERCFFSAIAGRKNSLALFESAADRETGELKLRLRTRGCDLAMGYAERQRTRPEEQARQMEQLQRQVHELRTQVAALETENQRYAAVVEGMRQRQKPEIQKTYETYETLYGILDQLETSLTAVGHEISAIGAKIPQT